MYNPRNSIIFILIITFIYFLFAVEWLKEIKAPNCNNLPKHFQFKDEALLFCIAWKAFARFLRKGICYMK